MGVICQVFLEKLDIRNTGRPQERPLESHPRPNGVNQHVASAAALLVHERVHGHGKRREADAP